MTDSISQVVLGINEAAESVVIVEGAAPVNDLVALIAAAPGLLHPDAAPTLAKAVNHIAKGSDYRVIDDVAAFEAEYRAQVAKEDLNAAWQEGVIRLRDHGLPDFTEVVLPKLQGNVLTFYAVDSILGLPYKVVANMAAPADPVVYRALALAPFPPSNARPAANPLFVGAVGTLNTTTGPVPLAEAPLVIDDIGDDDEPDER